MEAPAVCATITTIPSRSNSPAEPRVPFRVLSCRRSWGQQPTRLEAFSRLPLLCAALYTHPSEDENK